MLYYIDSYKKRLNELGYDIKSAFTTDSQADSFLITGPNGFKKTITASTYGDPNKNFEIDQLLAELQNKSTSQETGR